MPAPLMAALVCTVYVTWLDRLRHFCCLGDIFGRLEAGVVVADEPDLIRLIRLIGVI